MNASEASEKEGIMIAFLPTTSEWCYTELPHMTLVYVGIISQRSPSDFNSIAKDAATLAMFTNPFSLYVRDVDVFGDTDKVNVLRFRTTPELEALRRFVSHWNVSQYPFSPHATIGPANEYVCNAPGIVNFNRVMVGWGEESIVFKL